MPTATTQVAQIEAIAAQHGLDLAEGEPGVDFSGTPTARYTLTLPASPGAQQPLELSAAFDLESSPALTQQIGIFFAETATRLRNPRPELCLTLSGLPLSFGRFAWPFHASTSGADTFIVHGEVRLETGEPSLLHAKISAAMTQTFKEVVPAMEQPFAEGFIYNAIRKTMDQGQLELVKSGNRQPVPVTTRYYSSKQGRFVFNDTSAAQRSEFLAAKVFWLSGIVGGGAPVWLLDPRDAQYLNSTPAELAEAARTLVASGLIELSPASDFASATAALMAREAQYRAEIADALAFIKPSFNEDMRGGHTNM